MLRTIYIIDEFSCDEVGPVDCERVIETRTAWVGMDYHKSLQD